MLSFALTRWPGLMPQNFSAAYALAFCAGVYFPRKARWILPLGTMFIIDIVFNIYYRTHHVGLAPGSEPLSPNYPIVDSFTLTKLATFAAIIWLGTRFSTKSS